MGLKYFIITFICIFLLANLISSSETLKKSKKSFQKAEKNEHDDENYDLMADDDEGDDEDETSNEDFKFDDGEASKSDASPSEFHRLSWITVDLCKDVQCKPNQHCVMKSKEVATCVAKKKKQPTSTAQPQKNKRRPKPTGHIEATINGKRMEDCRQCPVTKPDFVCGTDNSTYSSVCRLNFHNCIHETKIRTACKGFCPCKHHKQEKQKDSRTRERWEKFYNKVKYEKSIWKNRDESRRMNEIDGYKQPKSVYPMPVDLATSNKQHKHHQQQQQLCTKEELKVMGNRLIDWFSVVVADQKRRKKVNMNKRPAFSNIPACTPEVTWMFHHLDFDNDKRLSLKELFDLEHDDKEKCLKPYLDTCDSDRDTFLNPYEWCTCFTTKSQSCTSAAKISRSGLIGAYVPQCDKRGYYTPVQCHGGSGICWCVDKNGVEFVNTRRRGKPDCDDLLNKARQRNAAEKESDDDDEDDKDDDDDDDDKDDDIEGSGSV